MVQVRKKKICHVPLFQIKQDYVSQLVFKSNKRK